MKKILLSIIFLFIFQIIFSQNDCVKAIKICGNTNLTGLTVSGFGTQELNISNACESDENNSIWLKVTIKNAGTLAFTIKPESNSLNEDFDFWIFGPNVTCSTLNTAIRCSTTSPSAAMLTSNYTGLNNTETDLTEGSGPKGNSFVKSINALANEVYYIIIDRPQGNSNFLLEWTGTATFFDSPIINTNPAAGNTLNLEKCGTTNSTSFDLTQNTPIAVGNQANIVTTYHLSNNDALTNLNPISNASNYTNTSNPQTVYIRLTNSATECFSVSSFTLKIGSLQVNTPPNLSACDSSNDGFEVFNLATNESVLTNGNANLKVTYHANNNDTVTIPTNYTNQTANTNQTVWAKVTDTTTGCFIYKSFDLIINSVPKINTNSNNTLNIDKCFNNTTTNFDLTQNTTIAVGTQTNIITNYYLSNNDANTNTNPISTPSNFTNTTNPQTIYIRLTNSTTNCFNVGSFELRLNPLQVNNPLNLEVCDLNNDGFVTFNLADNNTTLINGNSTYQVTYHANNNDTVTINTIYTNITANTNETVWAKITDTSTGCFVYKSFNLIINKVPIINTTPTLNIEKCDTINTSSFDLTQNNTKAIGNQTNIAVSYFLTSNDANANTNPIASPSNFTNTTNPQTIYIRLTNSTTNCFKTSFFEIKVNVLQVPNPQDISICDTNGDGFETFNLAVNTPVLTGGNANLQVTYHANNNDTVTIPTLYTNQTANTNQTVWAQVKNTVNGCFLYKSFQLIIHPIPTANPATLKLCDIGLNPDGFVSFNLNDAITTLTNNNTNLTTNFYLNQTQAQNNVNPLPTNYTNTSSPQTLYVRVTNSTTNCFVITTLTLNVDFTASVTSSILYKCEDTKEGFAEFNLADAGFETTGNTVTYFATSNDAVADQNPIPVNFTNTQAYNQTVYASVANSSSCTSINIIPLVVNKKPKFNILSTGQLCLNRPSATVKLKVEILNDNSNLYSYVWTPGGETTQEISITTPGKYDVTVTKIDPNTSCNTTQSITIKASEIARNINPIVVELTDNNSITIINQGIGDYVYSIDSDLGPYQSSNYFNPVSAGDHSIYIKDLNGCGTESVTVNLLDIPKFFTPNGDGIHDYWNIYGLNKNSINANSIINIFDRFGKLLKQLKAVESGWNGTYNGNQMPATDYWYAVNFADGRVLKGNFSLKR